MSVRCWLSVHFLPQRSCVGRQAPPEECRRAPPRLLGVARGAASCQSAPRPLHALPHLADDWEFVSKEVPKVPPPLLHLSSTSAMPSINLPLSLKQTTGSGSPRRCPRCCASYMRRATRSWSSGGKDQLGLGRYVDLLMVELKYPGIRWEGCLHASSIELWQPKRVELWQPKRVCCTRGGVPDPGHQVLI